MELKLKNITIEYTDFETRSQYMELADHALDIEALAGNATKQTIELLKILTYILVVRIETPDETITDKARFWKTIEMVKIVDDEDLGKFSEKMFGILTEEYSKRTPLIEEVKKNNI